MNNLHASRDRPESIARGVLVGWFGFYADVPRGFYATSGFALMLAKYLLEVTVLWRVVGTTMTPLEFFSPVLSAREELVAGAPDWLGWAWFLWTLPFLWIAVTMSLRRAFSAGHSPWLGLLILVPAVNLCTMVLLAILPNRRKIEWLDAHSTIHRTVLHYRSAALGLVMGLVIALVMVGVSVYAFDTYGASLFLGTPILMGVIAAVITNSVAPTTISTSIWLGMLTVILAGGVLLAFALEGVICIAMAAPIALPLGGLGGAIGKFIAETTRRPLGGTLAVLVFLPGWTGIEKSVTPKREWTVQTEVNIDADIDQVWERVIHFPNLAQPDEWYFRWGIACPLRAEIDGTGVGAVRRCIFTTGVFVEPITAWDAPYRLAFDVHSQPAPMFEMTPYRDLHPPHLDGALRSTRGEFVLERRPGGGTRLVGRTWYQLDMFPHAYWTLWSDLLIHRIHRRVLTHVKQHAEQPTAGPTSTN